MAGANSPPQHPFDFGFFVIGQYGRSECADKSPGAVDERVKSSEFPHMFSECSRHCHGTSRECSPNHRNSSDPPDIWACSCLIMMFHPMRRLAPHGGRVRARRRHFRSDQHRVRITHCTHRPTERPGFRALAGRAAPPQCWRATPPPQRFICPPERRLERARERNMGCVVCGSPCMHVVRARNGVLVTLTHAGSIYHVRLLWGE